MDKWAERYFLGIFMAKYSYDEVLAIGSKVAGVVVKIKNRNLKKSWIIDIRNVPSESLNPDKVCVYCENCGQYMIYYNGPRNMVDGKWKCDGCDCSITEQRVYNKIEKDNEQAMKELFD